MSFLQVFGPHTVQMPPRRPAWSTHLRAMNAVREANIPVPSEWLAVQRRYTDFIELPDTGVDRLAAAVVSGDGDIAALRALALTEESARGTADSAIVERVQSAVLDEMLAAYGKVAQGNYRLAAAKYENAAKKFCAAADHIDPEVNSDVLVTATSAARSAWMDAPALAADLEENYRILCAAASLAGADPDVCVIGVNTPVDLAEVQIGLGCDPGKTHRRKVWAAFVKTGGRTGRWGALAALGVKLRAASDPATAHYSRPVPLVPVTAPGGKIDLWDSYDGDLPRPWEPVNVVGWAGEYPSVKAAK